MSESRLSDGTDAVTSLTPRAHPVGTDPGFFALDRRRWRSLKDQYGGTLSRWYHDLAAECPRKTPNRYQHGRITELAEILGESAETTRRVLARLETAGMIRWTRATNQNNGEVVLLIDLERHKTPRPTTVHLPATSEAQIDPQTTPKIATSEPVDIGTGPALGAALGPALGAADLHRPLQGKRDIPRTNEPTTKNKPPQTPPADLSILKLGPVQMTGEDQHQRIIERTAQMIGDARENRLGSKAGRGALRKIADDVSEEYLDLIARWTGEGYNSERIALAVAERYLVGNDGINGNRHAVPWSAGEDLNADAPSVQPCQLCEGDGWIYIEDQRASLRCECQNVETGKR
jgi:hypothetical protein